MGEKNRGNVLFIVADLLRADCLETTVNGQTVLPNLREFMEDAVTFRRHYTVTCPCGPSRVSLLTGLYAMNHRSVRNGTPLRADISNLALEARKSGYEPLLFGYTDTSGDPRHLHPNDPAVRSFEKPMPGFKEITVMQLEADYYAWRAHLKAKGYDLPEHSRFFNPQDFDPETGPRPDDPAFYRAEDSDTAFLTDECMKELAVRTDQAWFAHVAYIRPHDPFIAPEPYNRMCRADEIPPPARMPTQDAEAAFHPFIAADLAGFDTINAYIEASDCRLDNEDPRDGATMRAVYFGLASEVDHHVGRLIRFLKDTGQYENTLIIITSDHGEMLGERRQWGKLSVFDSATRVPLIIRDPKRPSHNGSQVDTFTESVDVSPTILEWLSGDAPAAMNGASLLPWLEGNPPSGWRDYAYTEMEFGDPECHTRSPREWVGHTHCQRELRLGMREANFAVIQEDRYRFAHFNGGLPPLLFDTQSADGEFRNLADDQDYAGEVLRLTRKLLDHRMRHADHTLSDMKVTAGGTVNYRPSGPAPQRA